MIIAIIDLIILVYLMNRLKNTVALNYLLIFLPIAVTLVMASQLESGFNQFPYFIYSDGSYFYLEGEKLVSSGFDFVVLEAVHFKYYGHIVLNALSLYLIDDLVISGMLLKLFSLLLWSVCIYKVYVKFYFKIRGDKLYLYLFSILFFVAIWYSMTNLRDSFVSLIVLSFTLILLKHKLILQDYLYLSLLVLLIVFFRYEYLIFVMIAILLYLLTNKFIKGCCILYKLTFFVSIPFFMLTILPIPEGGNWYLNRLLVSNNTYSHDTQQKFDKIKGDKVYAAKLLASQYIKNINRPIYAYNPVRQLFIYLNLPEHQMTYTSLFVAVDIVLRFFIAFIFMPFVLLLYLMKRISLQSQVVIFLFYFFWITSSVYLVKNSALEMRIFLTVLPSIILTMFALNNVNVSMHKFKAISLGLFALSIVYFAIKPFHFIWYYL